MSLDITIKFKEPKEVNYHNTHKCCGSTIMICPSDYVEYTDRINMNLSHSMCDMASHIPVEYTFNNEDYESTLYEVVWNADENNIANTTIVEKALRLGISYMIANRNELLQYNPKSGWGGYHSFVDWLMCYWQNCIDNPDCEIIISK